MQVFAWNKWKIPHGNKWTFLHLKPLIMGMVFPQTFVWRNYISTTLISSHKSLVKCPIHNINISFGLRSVLANTINNYFCKSKKCIIFNVYYRPGSKKSKFDMTLIRHSPFKLHLLNLSYWIWVRIRFIFKTAVEFVLSCCDFTKIIF